MGAGKVLLGFLGICGVIGFVETLVATGLDYKQKPISVKNNLTPSQKLDSTIASKFILYKDTLHNYRIGVDENYLKSKGTVTIPSFTDKHVRGVSGSDWGFESWFSQVPIGTYMISGLEVAVHGCDYRSIPEDGQQTASIKGNGISMNLSWGINGYDNIKNICVNCVSFNGKTYNWYNDADSSVVASVNRMMNKFVPIIDSIDNAEVKQYQDFRAKYITNRNDSVVSSMKKAMVLR